MKANLVKIGNSKGIRIPKAILEQCGFKDRVEIEVKGNTLIVMPTRKPREGWEDAARWAHEHGDDELLLGDFPNEFDEKEWTW